MSAELEKRLREIWLAAMAPLLAVDVPTSFREAARIGAEDSQARITALERDVLKLDRELEQARRELKNARDIIRRDRNHGG